MMSLAERAYHFLFSSRVQAFPWILAFCIVLTSTAWANEIEIPTASDQPYSEQRNAQNSTPKRNQSEYSERLPEKALTDFKSQPSLQGSKVSFATALKNSMAVWIPPGMAFLIYLSLPHQQKRRFVQAGCFVGLGTIMLYGAYFFWLLPENNVNYDKLAMLVFWPSPITRTSAVDILGQYSWFVSVLEFVFVSAVYAAIAASISGLRPVTKLQE